VEPSALDALFARVRDIEAIGSTNLHDGLLLGAARAASSPKHPVRRVLVISDGQANVGPSTPEALGDVAARWTEAAVQVSAIGIGLDYDERTLGALALRSSGRLYHLADPAQMAQILDQEVRLLAQTSALGAYLEIVPGEGVDLLGAEFVGARARGNALRVDLGTLYAGQHREVLFRARVRQGASGERELAKARLVYRPRADRPEWSAQTVPLRAVLGDNPYDAARSADPRVQAMVARHEAAMAQQRAAEMLNAGQSAEAAQALDVAEDDLVQAAGSQRDERERARLVEQAARIKQTKQRARDAKTRKAARETALDSYGYSFADEGLSAPAPSTSVRPPR
jgi:Ca-activated chloride channel family protein